MKYKTLVDNINELLGIKKTNKKLHKNLKSTLKKLKDKEKELKLKCDSETDQEKNKEREDKIKILHQQRKKGLLLLKEINK